VICTIILVPWLADKCGRKWVVVVSYLIFIATTVGILFASDLIALYVLMFIAGTTFGGRVVVGLNYLLEF